MSGRRPRVVYWNNQPTPYVVARLNAVADRGDVDLEVWFDELRMADRSWDVRPDEWRFRWRIIEPVTLLGRTISLPVGELAQTRPDLLICNYDRLNCTLGAVLGRRFSGRLALRALPSYPAQSPPSRLQDLAWWLSFHLADGAKVPGPDGREFCRRNGLPSDRTWKVTQSIDVGLYGSARHDRTERAGVRFVVMSRMIRSKGIDELLEAWRSVRDRMPDARLTLVGDGADLERLQKSSIDLDEVEWLGFRQPEELPALYAAADVLIFPTLGDPNGLVVEEAMAAGLPVLSTDAAGDIRARVPEGEAGWVVPAGDVPALAAAIVAVAELPKAELRRIGESNVERADGFVVEHYAEDFTAFVRGVLARPRRRNLAARLAGLAATLLALLTRTGPATRAGCAS